MADNKAPYEVALRVFQSIHGQELIKAELRTRERTREELSRLGIAEQMENLYPQDDEDTDRIRDIIAQLRRHEMEAQP